MSEELRAKIMQQTDQLSLKPRFGLFSQLASTAIGETNLYKPHKSKLDSQHKPITQARNIATSPIKSGQLSSSYFGPLNTLANFSIHDVYIDEGRRLVKEEKQTFQKGKTNERPFIPACTIKNANGAPYPWEKTKTQPDNPRRFRNSEGGVIVEPRGFYTNCKSNVETRLNKIPRHITDPYDNEEVIDRERRKLSRSKEGEVSFKLGNYAPKLLNSNKQVFACDVPLQERKQRSYSQNHIYKHQTVFRGSNPPKSGLKGFLAPFPQHIPCPPFVKSRSPTKNDQERKEFKRMSTQKSQPCPSITSNPTNMRRYISHSFNKRF